MSIDPHSNQFETHLSDIQLRAYVNEELADDELWDAEKHLIACEQCASRLDEVAGVTTKFARQIKSILSRRASDATLSELDDDLGDNDSVASWSPGGPPPNHGSRRFRKQKIIGQGGMGEIWQAYDCLVKHHVALKQLRQEKAYSPKHLARFKREVLLTAMISHPGTVSVIDYSGQPGNAYYVMNLVQGSTLTSLIIDYHQKRRNGDAPFSEFMSLVNAFISVCNTIAYAHAQGVLHRDIKSENVMVGKFGQVTLLDWGLAKSFELDGAHGDATDGEDPLEAEDAPVSVRTTIEGQSLGTPAFMSPEQATGSLDQIDVRTDTYMLCGMLYEILTDHAPFGGDDVDNVIEDVIHKQPTPCREHAIDCPVRLEQICMQGLAKDREDRFQTVGDLTEEVQRWATGHAERAKADEFFERCFELAFDAMGIVDFRRGLQNLNAAWQPMFGWDPKEITGRTHYEMIHPDDQVCAARALSKANRTKEPQQVVVRLLCKDGHYQSSVWNLAPYVEEASVLIIGRQLD